MKTEFKDAPLTNSLGGHRIAFLGAGKMAEALVKGLVGSGQILPECITASDRHPENSKRLATRYGIHAAPDNLACVSGATLVILAIKPQELAGVVTQIAPHLSSEVLVVSVAAGVTTERIEQLLNRPIRVIRSMPNTGAMVGQSATALSMGKNARAEDLIAAQAIFEAVGRVVVVDEIHLDAVTGLSGSGPAYIFLIIEAMTDAGVKVGLSREIAQLLSVQTLLGAAHMLLETGEHPARLKDQVTSPGGTTIAGLHTLEAGGLRTTLMDAVEAATLRSRELGKSGA